MEHSLLLHVSSSVMEVLCAALITMEAVIPPPKDHCAYNGIKALNSDGKYFEYFQHYFVVAIAIIHMQLLTSFPTITLLPVCNPKQYTEAHVLLS
jgi:uncharacterized membrane protein